LPVVSEVAVRSRALVVVADEDTVRPVRVPKEVSEEAVTPEFRVAPVNVPAAAVTVMSPVPSKDTPLMV